MVEHRETDGGGEGCVLERHLGRVCLDYVRALAEVAAQPFAVTRLELDHAQPPRPAGEHARGCAKSRPDLEHVIAQFEVGERPWDQLALDPAAPPARGTDQCVDTIHRITVASA